MLLQRPAFRYSTTLAGWTCAMCWTDWSIVTVTLWSLPSAEPNILSKTMRYVYSVPVRKGFNGKICCIVTVSYTIRRWLLWLFLAKTGPNAVSGSGRGGQGAQQRKHYFYYIFYKKNMFYRLNSWRTWTLYWEVEWWFSFFYYIIKLSCFL